MNGRYRFAGIILLLAAAAGCALLRPQWMQLAADAGLEPRWVKTDTFRHLVLSNHDAGSHLRIYVEGDGSPWINRNRIAADPTPVNPVLLRLMHRADHAAAYLGRPCYFGSAGDSSCGARWWTFDRYSQPVIESMCEAANKLIEERDAATVQLVGYSGGGTIVIGMTTCTHRLVAITTIAGNLLPTAWVRYHGYTELRDLALVESGTSTRVNVPETHWQCASDQVIPIAITEDYFIARPDLDRRIINDCTHSTGWQQVWPELVQLGAPQYPRPKKTN